MLRIKSFHQAALPQPFPQLANPAPSLENWTATMNLSTTAAAIVLRDSHVSLTTQPLELESGRCHRHLLALQTAVAAKVKRKFFEIYLFNGALTPYNR